MNLAAAEPIASSCDDGAVRIPRINFETVGAADSAEERASVVKVVENSGLLDLGAAGSSAAFVVQQISGGITNRLYRVSRGKAVDQNEEKLSPASLEHSVLVRIYGENTDLFIDRATDEKNFRELSKVGFGVKLLATFQNGRIEEFYDGRTLEPDDLADPEISRRIAIELADMHCLRVDVGDSSKTPMLVTRLKEWLQLASTVSFPDDAAKQKKLDALDIEKLKVEVARLSHVLPKLDSPVVFCHNDLLAMNILVNDEKLGQGSQQDLVFVDVEYAGYNYRGFDLANHFCEYSGFDYSQFREKFPSERAQKAFLKTYLERVNMRQLSTSSESKSPIDNPITDDLLVQVLLEVQQFSIASHMFWGLWAIMQAKYSANEFDYLTYGAGRFEALFYMKKNLASHQTEAAQNDSSETSSLSAIRLEKAVRTRLGDVDFVRFVDESGGCGSKFSAVIVSSRFDGVRLLDRHRMINGESGVLNEEMEHIHALQLKTWTREQYEKKRGKLGLPALSQ